VESFKFHRMVVKPRLPLGSRTIKAAIDGEVTWMRTPLEFRVSAKPLYLLKRSVEGGATGVGGSGA
jgi:hypothetical protein